MKNPMENAMKTAKATRAKPSEALALQMNAAFAGKLKHGRFVTPRWVAEAKKRHIGAPGDIANVEGHGEMVILTVRVSGRKLAYGFDGIEASFGTEQVALVACDPNAPATVGDSVTFIRDGRYAAGWVTWASLRTPKVTVLRDHGREVQATEMIDGHEIDSRYDGKHFAGVDGWCRQASDNIAQGPHAPRPDRPQQTTQEQPRPVAEPSLQAIPQPQMRLELERAPAPDALPAVRIAHAPAPAKPYVSARDLRDMPAPSYRPQHGGIAARAKQTVRRIPLDSL